MFNLNLIKSLHLTSSSQGNTRDRGNDILEETTEFRTWDILFLKTAWDSTESLMGMGEEFYMKRLKTATVCNLTLLTTELLSIFIGTMVSR